jgi:hypothetical protein
VREFVKSLNHLSQARQELLKIQKEQGSTQPLCPMMGTLNRWFHKYKEAGRLWVLRDAVKEFDARHDNDDVSTSGIQEEDWDLIEVYIKVIEPFEKASKLLGGDSYPAACMVIPMLAQVCEVKDTFFLAFILQINDDLQKLPDKMENQELRERRSREPEDRQLMWVQGGKGRAFAHSILTNFERRYVSQAYFLNKRVFILLFISS